MFVPCPDLVIVLILKTKTPLHVIKKTLPLMMTVNLRGSKEYSPQLFSLVIKKANSIEGRQLPLWMSQPLSFPSSHLCCQVLPAHLCYTWWCHSRTLLLSCSFPFQQIVDISVTASRHVLRSCGWASTRFADLQGAALKPQLVAYHPALLQDLLLKVIWAQTYS